MGAPISKIDHVAITTDDLPKLVAFYTRALGAAMESEHRADDGTLNVVRISIGGSMLNIHRVGHGHWLVARSPTPGAVDICFRWEGSIGDAVAFLEAGGVEIIEGPVARIGAGNVQGQSVYFRDSDGNLLEFLTTTMVVDDRS